MAMFQQNPLLLGQTNSIPTIVPYTFTTSELDSLRSKLQLAEQQMASTNSKNGQSIIQLSLNEIRTLQKMIDMTYLQGLSGSGGFSSVQNSKNSSMGLKSSNTAMPPSNYVCHKCDIPGHYVHDCPNVIGKGPPPSNYLCYKCNIPGHWIQECPLGNQQDYSKPPPPGYCCHRCGVPGHWIKNCPTNSSLDNNSNNDNNYNYQRDKDTSNYGQRDKKFSHHQMNTQQVNILNKNDGYMENDNDERESNTRMSNVTQGGTYIKKKRHLDEM